MSEFLGLELSSLCLALQKSADTLILYHARPDGDAIGSAYALRGILSALGSDCFCRCVDKIPTRLAFLTEEDQLPAGFSPERVISVDSASPAQLGALFDEYKVDIMIDHHASGTPYADNYIRSDASATGEIIFDISRCLLKSGALSQIPDGVDRLIYAAISSDTGCFRYSNVTPHTHRVAAELVDHVDAADINRRMFEIKTAEQLLVERAAMERMERYCGGRISVVAIDHADIAALGLPADKLDTLIDVARCVDGADVAISVRRVTPGSSFRVSMRSNSDINVAAACALFGGGGHVRAAGCNIEAEELSEAIQKAIKALEEQM